MRGDRPKRSQSLPEHQLAASLVLRPNDHAFALLKLHHDRIFGSRVADIVVLDRADDGVEGVRRDIVAKHLLVEALRVGHRLFEDLPPSKAVRRVVGRARVVCFYIIFDKGGIGRVLDLGLPAGGVKVEIGRVPHCVNKVWKGRCDVAHRHDRRCEPLLLGSTHEKNRIVRQPGLKDHANVLPFDVFDNRRRVVQIGRIGDVKGSFQIEILCVVLKTTRYARERDVFDRGICDRRRPFICRKRCQEPGQTDRRSPRRGYCP